MTAEALRVAEDVLREGDRYRIGAPDVAPVTGGGVFIEWEAGGRDLEFDILPGGRIQFVKIHEDGHMEDGRDIALAKLPALFLWLAGATAAT